MFRRSFSRLAFSFLLPGVVAVGCLLAGAPLKAVAGEPVTLFMDQSLQPDAAALAIFDLCIVNADARADLESGRALGNKLLARVDLLNVTAQSRAAAVAQSLGVPFGDSPEPNSRRLDPAHPEWLTVVVHELVESAAEKGFDGFVLAGLDAIGIGAERAAAIQAIASLDARFPDKQIVLEGGFDLMPEVRRWVDGFLFVGIRFRTQNGERLPNSPEAVAQIERRILEVKRHGLPAYAVDFATPGEAGAIAAIGARLQDLGAIPFITTASLTGVNLGPMREISRRVAVIHSGTAANTWSARIAHGPLEWLGFQLDYIQADNRIDLAAMGKDAGFAGVIIDAGLCLPEAQQAELAAIVKRLAEQRTPLLLAGLPWQSSQAWQDAAKALGLGGTGLPVEIAGKAAVERADKAMLAGRNLPQPRTEGLRDLRAPRNSQVLLSIREASEDGVAKVFDQAFLTSWGGVWLDPLAVAAGPQLDPLLVLEKWLGGCEVAPVADTTTLNGRRLMISHVSGEGFATISSQAGLPTAAEVMRDRILRRYAGPFTVAVCESDVRGWTPGLDGRDAMRYEEIARSIFALPQVEAASNSFSRPSHWRAGETIGGALQDGVPDRRRGIEREIAGSMSYLHRHLLPAGKKVELMLWPAPAMPSPEAVAYAHKIGAQNLSVTASDMERLPGRPETMGPRAWMFASGMQTIAASPARSQDVLDAPAMIAAFASTDGSRRRSPVHVPLSFLDARSEGSLAAVEQVLDWCAAQPLHAVSAATHARMVGDAARTRVLERQPGHWIIVNAGHARTLRLPAYAGTPDMARSRGVAGFMEHGGQLYIHTLGLRRVDLVMKSRTEPLQLRLAEANGSVEFFKLAAGRALMQVTEHRPVELRFAGIQPGATCLVSANGQPVSAMADAKGQVEFTVPPRSVIQLQVMPSDYAAMR